MRYLLKRLVSIIPALFLLSLLVFILKTSLPEGIVDRYLREEQLQSGVSNPSEIEALAREIRTELKLDQPVFYFSITSSVLPDSLRKMYPPEKADFYKSLLINYGSVREVNAYYREIERMMLSGNDVHKATANALYFITDHEEIDASLMEVNQTDIQVLSNAFRDMLSNRDRAGAMRPKFNWHGSANQFHQWMAGVLTLDFGSSIVDNSPVTLKIGSALGNTLLITIPALIILAVIGIPLGIWLSQSDKWQQRLASTALFGIDAMPLFWLSLILIILLASDTFLNILPAYGLGVSSASGINWTDRIQYFVLPVTALVLSAVPYVSIQTSKAISDERSKLYVIAARAKGLSESRILRVHILRNSLVPIITIFSEYLTAAFTGSLVAEVIFSIPGMGKLLYDSVMIRDYNVVVAIILIIGLVKMLSNLLADMGYRAANPSVDY